MPAEIGLQAHEDTLHPSRAATLGAHLMVLAACVVVSAAIAGVSWAPIADQPSFFGSVIKVLAAVMAGMAIMFTASLLNLRTLRPSYERLARGEQDAEIPPVWCPVRTSAAQAAQRLTRLVAAAQEGKDT